MTEVVDKLDTVRALIKGNFKTKNTSTTGLLTCDEAEYLECLKLNTVKFYQLMGRDEANWTKNLQMSRRQAKEMSA